MFEQQTAPPPSQMAGPALISVLIHVGVIAALVMMATPKAKVEEKEVALTLMRQLPPPPPPPPPPGGPRPVVQPQRKPTPRKEVVIRKPEKIEPIKEEPKKPEPEPEPAPEPEPEPAGVQGGVEGGVAGGTVGGTVGGTLGGTVGGRVEPVKPKNVPPFVIQRDVIRQTPPRLSEVFKTSHRGQGTITGLYRICVATDGQVYEVTAVKSVPGADEDISSGIREGWLYKPQTVPVCFLYNIPITIQ